MFNTKKRRWRASRWCDELAKYVYSKTVTVEGWRKGKSDDQRVKGAGFDDSKWPAAHFGKEIGKIDEFIWLRNTVTIPKDFAGGEVELYIDCGRRKEIFGQTGVVYVDGKETVGLDRFHKSVTLSRRAKGGERFCVAAEVYTGPVESFTILEFGNPSRYIAGPYFQNSELRLVNPAGFKLYHDFLAAVDILETTEAGSRDEAVILAAISDATTAIDLLSGEKERNASFKTASAILDERLFTGTKGDASGKAYLVGQSHIDMAWLWRRRETIRKCASTMANTLALQKRYPFYSFSHSQAQGFQWLKDRYPSLFAGCKKAVKAGRLTLVGGMWVEADLNCAGAEALARQFMYGQRFFEKEFGVRSRVGWLIDTFGYSWAMPQILKESGIDYFVSTKPTWNDTNVFPFALFWWEGPDGSRVMTHIPPLSYGRDMSTAAVIETIQLDKEARLGIGPMILYGKSDGGGGPRVADLEAITRVERSPFAPKIETMTAEEWFDRIPTEKKLPVFCDEMYVETHRGTYTAQARTKRGNRKSECALYTAEMAATAAFLTGAAYPSAKIEEAWKKTLFNQFHDILPGSSIAPVHDDAERDHAEVLASTAAITEHALTTFAKSVDTVGEGDAVLVFNPSAWDRTDVVEIDVTSPAASVTDSEGAALPSQKVSGAKKLAVLVTVPACGWKVVRVVPGRHAEGEPLASVDGNDFETPLLKLRLNASGQIARLYDKKARREVLSRGESGNRLQFLENIPVEYEAWDIDEWVNDKVREVTGLQSMEVVENGPVRTVVALRWQAGKSTFDQKMVLYGHTKRIDFATEVDWHEKKTLLKVAFGANVRSRRATYETAFGAIDRATNESNPWDWARFEVPAHKWADLSQTDYGVSLLNDSKYGYDTHENVLRLSLLRSPEAPDPRGEEGGHEFTYSLLPHEGNWRNATTVAEAFDLNVPLEVKAVPSSGGGLPPEGWLFRVKATEGAQPVLSAVKKCEDTGAVLLRFYEPCGGDAKAVVSTPFEIAGASQVNFLEEEKSKVRVGSNKVRVQLSPYKVASLKLKLK